MILKICYTALCYETAVTVGLPQKNNKKACGRKRKTWRKIVYYLIIFYKLLYSFLFGEKKKKDVRLSSFLNNLFYTYCANVNSLVINVQTCIKQNF